MKCPRCNEHDLMPMYDEYPEWIQHCPAVSACGYITESEESPIKEPE